MGRIGWLILAALLGACGAIPVGDSQLRRIQNIVVIYAENHSFDNLYGMFPGANGVAMASQEQKTQLDHDGRPLPHLPPVYADGEPNPKYPQKLPNGPFRIDEPPVGARFDAILASPIHHYWQNREHIKRDEKNK